MPIPANPLHLPDKPGTYGLLLQADSPITIRAGALGSFDLAPGHYLYVGSALGPGGLSARVNRHLKRDKRAHWHIDALTAAAPMTAVWISISPERLECTWAKRLMRIDGISIPIKGFGSSDCRCPAHLFYLPDDRVEQAWNQLGNPRRHYPGSQGSVAGQ
nr:GIY-YIG nuclease family protein [Anaerolineae bacterium]